MKNASLLGVLLALAVTPAPAKDNSLSYDYIEANYHWYDPDEDVNDLDIYGYSLDVSGQISPFLFFAASYTYSRTEDFTVLNTTGYQEANFASAGLGAKWSILPPDPQLRGLDLVGTVDFVYADSTGGGGFDDSGGEYDTGYRLGVALRAGLGAYFEIEPGFRFTEVLEDEVSEGYIQLRARVHGPIWIVGGYSHSDGDDSEGVDAFNAGARIYW